MRHSKNSNATVWVNQNFLRFSNIMSAYCMLCSLTDCMLSVFCFSMDMLRFTNIYDGYINTSRTHTTYFHCQCGAMNGLHSAVAVCGCQGGGVSLKSLNSFGHWLEFVVLPSSSYPPFMLPTCTRVFVRMSLCVRTMLSNV